jgi:predicted nucleotidyltransferase
VIDLAPEQLALVREILRRLVPDRQVVAFGSRVKQTAKRHSDLDLCVMGETPLTLRQIGELEAAFAESDLPMRVDVVDWTTATAAFRAGIAAQSAPVSAGCG